MATAWVLLLIAQPMLMRSGRLRTHRALGKVSWALAPVFVLAAVLLVLIWLERNAREGRWVFPLMLGVFVLAQIPALFGLTDQAWWQGFARWFAGLPLT